MIYRTIHNNIIKNHFHTLDAVSRKFNVKIVKILANQPCILLPEQKGRQKSPLALNTLKWAMSCENLSYAIRKEQRCRSACASAQADQHLCCSLLRQYDMYTCYIQSFKILASFCSWAGWFVPYLVENPARHIFARCGSNVKCIYDMYRNDTKHSEKSGQTV